MKTAALLGSLVAALVLCAGCGPPRPGRARPLFDAIPFAEWRVVGAAATFALDETTEVLVGKGPIPRNGFLASPRELHDFRLAAEVRLGSAESPRGEGMNSGIQIRSREQDGTIAGLQIEVDPTERRWSGGVYDERGRGWLAPLKDDPAAMAAFRPGEWNLYEIECIGPRIRTRVNGVACAEWYDGIVSGLLAFQVHGGDACEVAFRAPRIEELGAHAWSADGCAAAGAPDDPDGWRCAVPPDARGVRVDAFVGAAVVELRAEDGAVLRSISVEAVRPSTLEIVWLDGKGAVLLGGARVAQLAFGAPAAGVVVRGVGVSVGGCAVLRAKGGAPVDGSCGEGAHARATGRSAVGALFFPVIPRDSP